MDNPLFSIITITYNAADSIAPTMESLAAQTCRDFEHIIIDGASSDSTLAIARKIGGKDLRVVSERDSGLYDAMNKGLRFARGKYVLFLNAGDAFAAPVSLSLYAEAAALSPDIIYGDTLIVDSNRRVLRPRHLSVPESLTFSSFSKGMLVCHQAFCVRREIAPPYDISYRFSADYDWTVKCLKATTPTRCVNLHAVTIHYLDNGISEKHKIDSLKERFFIMKKHYGLGVALGRHLQFVPRALSRKFGSGN